MIRSSENHLANEELELENKKVQALLIDLQYKGTEIQERANKLIAERDAEIAPIIERYDALINPLYEHVSMVLSTINNLKELYSASDFESRTAPQRLVSASDEKISSTSDTDVPYEEHKGRLVIRHAIVNAIRKANEFLTTQEVYDDIVKRYPEENIQKTRIQIGLRDARRAKDIVGIPVTISLSGIQTYVHGLRKFLTDAENSTIIGEQYRDKLDAKIFSLGYSLVESIDRESTEEEGSGKKLAPAGTGANSEIVKGIGGQPSSNATETQNGPISPNGRSNLSFSSKLFH